MGTSIACARTTAVVLGFAASCFSPDYADDLACSETHQCPPGQSCAIDGRCGPASPIDHAGQVLATDVRNVAIASHPSGFLIAIDYGLGIVIDRVRGDGAMESLASVELTASKYVLDLHAVNDDAIVVAGLGELGVAIVRLGLQTGGVEGPTIHDEPNSTSIFGTTSAVSETTLGVTGLGASSIRFRPFALDASPLAPAEVVVMGLAREEIDLVGTASGFAMIWPDTMGTRFALFDVDGAAGAQLSLGHDFYNSRLAASATGFALGGMLAVDDDDWAAHVAVMSTSGAVSALTRLETAATPEAGYRSVRIATGQDTIGAFWPWPRGTLTELYFAELSTTGVVRQGPIAIATGTETSLVDIVWNDTLRKFLVAWEDRTMNTVYYQLIDPA